LVAKRLWLQVLPLSLSQKTLVPGRPQIEFLHWNQCLLVVQLVVQLGSVVVSLQVLVHDDAVHCFARKLHLMTNKFGSDRFESMHKLHSQKGSNGIPITREV
jgi:hypothetical protein